MAEVLTFFRRYLWLYVSETKKLLKGIPSDLLAEAEIPLLSTEYSPSHQEISMAHLKISISSCCQLPLLTISGCVRLLVVLLIGC